jgi:hypothetical protein
MPAPHSPNLPPPAWQAVLGFAPTARTPAAQLLAGARKLLAHLRREYARCLEAWHQLPDPHWRPYQVFGPHDTPLTPEDAGTPADAAADAVFDLRCPFAFWDPVMQIASALEISECQLTRLCKLASGLSARQWWDVTKARDPETGVRARFREELARDAAEFFRAADPNRATLDELQQFIRRTRRLRGEATFSRAFHWGFRNHARLQEAALVCEDGTVAELEFEWLGGFFQAWRADYAADPRKQTAEGRRAAQEAAARGGAQAAESSSPAEAGAAGKNAGRPSREELAAEVNAFFDEAERQDRARLAAEAAAADAAGTAPASPATPLAVAV